MDYKLVGLDEEKQAIERAVELDIPLLAVGPTGCGKTTLIKHVATAKDKKLVRVSLNGEVGIPELVGKWLVEGDCTKWQDGVLVDAMRHGHWIVLDEINAALPEVLFCLNSVLDDARALTISEKDGEVVKSHADFRVFASMNPAGDYTGTKELNMALLSRFGVMLEVDYQTPKKELEIIKQTGLAEDVSKIVVDIGTLLRKAHKENVTTHIVSTRDLLTLARLLHHGATMVDALEWAIINKMHKDERVTTVEKLRTGLSLKLNWKDTADKIVKNLTDELVLSIRDLETKRTKLEAIVKDMQGKLKDIEAAVSK